MRIFLDPRTRRLLRRVPRTNVYSLAEIALLTLLAIQCARLVWAAVTPLGPVGEWKAIDALRPALAARPELLGSFDPFFRLTGDTAPVAVTGLDLKLFGVREDRASGRGSAIIGAADGAQRSFAVGDEIMPGVVLVKVEFDNVTISRNGVPEQVFIDQSAPAEIVSPAPAPAPAPAAPAIVAPPAASAPAPAAKAPPVKEQP